MEVKWVGDDVDSCEEEKGRRADISLPRGIVLCHSRWCESDETAYFRISASDRSTETGLHDIPRTARPCELRLPA
jgi:hypothetical protein